MKTATNWALLLLAALVLTSPATRLDPVMLALRLLCLAGWGIFFYDLWRAGLLRKTVGQIHREAEAHRVPGTILQTAALLLGTWAARL